jgi:opacity protein-like surface antigen
MKYFKILITSLVLCFTSYQASACLANEKGGCQSPEHPGFSIFYHPIESILKVEKYDENYSWYTTENGSFLLLTFKFPDDYRRINISKYYKWYCVSNFSGYCAPLAGMDGVIFK